MSIVLCNRCDEEKSLNNCWCVIDSKTKERYYECKKTCQKATQIEITIPSYTESEEEQEQQAEPEQVPGLLERAWKWFSGSSEGYKRMKVE